MIHGVKKVGLVAEIGSIESIDIPVQPHLISLIDCMICSCSSKTSGLYGEKVGTDILKTSKISLAIRRGELE